MTTSATRDAWSGTRSLADLSATWTGHSWTKMKITREEWRTLALMAAVVIVVFAFSYWQEYWG